MKKRKLKFHGSLDDLKGILRKHNIGAQIYKQAELIRFETIDGAYIHWYSNGTICFQGHEIPRLELEEKLKGVFDGSIKDS